MRLSLHLPAIVTVPDGWSPAQRARLQQTVERAFHRAVSKVRHPGLRIAIVPAAPRRPKVSFTQPQRRREEQREHFDPVRLQSAEETYGLPSYDEGGRQRQVPVQQFTFEGITLTSGGPAETEIVVGANDHIIRRDYPSTAVLQAQGNEYWAAEGSPYVVAANLWRAVQWGARLFGRQGFAVFLAPHAMPDGPFEVVALNKPLSIRDLDGLDPENYVVRPGDFVHSRLLLVVTNDPKPIGRARGALSFQVIDRIMARVPQDQRWLDPSEIELAAQFLTQRARGTGTASELILHMDRTLFAALPWDTRLEYLQIVLEDFLDEPHKKTILEIIQSTRNEAELEAIFARLRQAGVYELLFARLDGDVFALLQFLGDFRPGETLTWRYLLDILLEVGVVPSLGMKDPVRELRQWIDGLVTWLLGILSGIKDLLTHPGDIVEGLGHIFELVLVVQRAQLGDPEAIALVTQMVRQAGAAAAKAIRGMRYAEELGTPYGQRGGGASIAADIIGRLKAMVVFEVLSWFIGIGEIKAAIGSLELGEKLAIVARILKSARLFGKAAEAGAEAARLERVLAALARAAEIAEDARLARVVELLPEEHLALINRVAREVELPAGAGLEALRTALRGNQELLGLVDRLADTMAVAAKLEAKAAQAGGVTAEMATGLRALLGHSNLDRAALEELIDHVPATHLDEYLRTLTYVRPEHFGQWGLTGLKELAEHPRALALVREGGSDLFNIVRQRTGSWDGTERFLEGLAIKRNQIGNPADYQRFLDRLGQNEAAAFDEVANARHAQQLAEATQVGRVAELGLRRLREGNRTKLLEELQDIAAHDQALLNRRASELAGLTDRELDGLEQVARLEDPLVDWGDTLDTVLGWSAQSRAELLGLVGEVGPHAIEGLEKVLRGILSRKVSRAGTELTSVQGGWGQLYAARTLIGRGARNLRFEVRGAGALRRDVDIIADIGGRIHVEVKTNLTGVPSFEKDQVIKDLVRHASTNYDDLVYLYHPSTQSRLPQLGQDMLDLFNESEVRRLFQQNGLNLPQARQAFQRWLSNGGLGTYSL
jgi:hypothetical protein